MRFTIRDLLWLTVVVALGVGWWIHHRAWGEKYADTAHDSELWQARAESLQVQVGILVERLPPSRLAPAPNPPKK